MKNIADLRLLKYSEHLTKIEGKHYEHGLFTTVEIYCLEERVRIHCHCQCHDWAFQELCVAFPKYWYYGEDGEPVLKSLGPGTNVAEAVCSWFQLDADEFIHLFDVSSEGMYQDIENYGGKKLTIDSNCRDLAENIIQLVNRRASS